MTTVQRRILAFALTFISVASLPEIARAQLRENHNPEPAILSFVLRHAGQIALDPFASSGRREVLQLMAGTDPEHGSFRRARLDRIGSGDWAVEGWYEIRGNTIHLYHHDKNGSATGRVEIGRYLENTICLQDPETGQPLAFEFLDPEPASTSTPASYPSTIDTTARHTADEPDTEEASTTGPAPNSTNRCASPEARTS